MKCTHSRNLGALYQFMVRKPVGVAQEHGVVLVQVLYCGGEGGAGVLPPLLVGPGQACVPVAGVGVGDLDGEEVPAGGLLNPGGQLLDVARGHHAGGGDGVHVLRQDGILRPGEVGHQGAARPIAGGGRLGRRGGVGRPRGLVRAAAGGQGQQQAEKQEDGTEFSHGSCLLCLGWALCPAGGAGTRSELSIKEDG